MNQPEVRKCPYCGTTFTPNNHNQKFCSYQCRWDNKRKRKSASEASTGLGIGSPVSRWHNFIVPFWARAFARTARHGFSEAQQFEIAEQLKRKGIPLPTVEECKAGKAKAIEWNEAYPDFASPPETYDVLIAFIRRSRPTAARKERTR